MQLISQTLKNVLPPQNNQKQQEQEDPPYITTLKTNEYLIIRVPSKANQCCFTNGNLIEILTNDTTIFKSSDNNSACLQFCCCILTPFTYDLFDTSPLISYYHPFTCFPCCFKCCCRQSVIYSKDNKSNGRVIENWRYHIPSYRVVDSSGVHQFDLQPPTCCGGYCVDYYHAGCCRSDFFLFPPNSTSKFGTQVGHVKWVSYFLNSFFLN